MPNSGDFGGAFNGFARDDPSSPSMISEEKYSETYGINGSDESLLNGCQRSQETQTDQPEDRYMLTLDDDRLRRTLEDILLKSRMEYEQELLDLREQLQVLEHKAEDDKKFFEEILAERELERENDQNLVANMRQELEAVTKENEKLLQRVRFADQGRRDAEAELQELRESQSEAVARIDGLMKEAQLKDELLSIRDKIIIDLETASNQQAKYSRVPVQLRSLTEMPKSFPSISSFPELRRNSNPSFLGALKCTIAESAEIFPIGRRSYRNSREGNAKKSLAEEVHESLLTRPLSTSSSTKLGGSDTLHPLFHLVTPLNSAPTDANADRTTAGQENSIPEGQRLDLPGTPEKVQNGTRTDHDETNCTTKKPPPTRPKVTMTDFIETRSSTFQEKPFVRQYSFRDDPQNRRRWRADLPEPRIRTDVTSLAVGLDVLGVMVKLIPRGSVAPTRNSHILTSVEDNQSSLRIRILQGEQDSAEYNHQLSEFLLPLQPARKGIPKVKVSIETTANGDLSVSAKEENSNSGLCLTVTGYQNWLCSQMTKTNVANSRHYLVDDGNIANKIQTGTHIAPLLPPAQCPESNKSSNIYSTPTTARRTARQRALQWLASSRKPSLESDRDRDRGKEIKQLLKVATQVYTPYV